MNAGDITLTVNSGRGTARSSDQSAASLTDDEDSSGVELHSPSHASPPSAVGSQDSSDHGDTDFTTDEYDDSWTNVSKADVGFSESEPSASSQPRITEGPRRRHSRRDGAHVRLAHRVGPAHRQHPPAPPSLGSEEDLVAYGPGLPLRQRRPLPYEWPPAAGGHGQAYAPGYPSQGGYMPYPQSGGPPPGHQVVPFNNPVSQYQYPQYQHQGHGANPGYFGHSQPGGSGPLVSPLHGPGANLYSSQDLVPHPGSQPFYVYPHPSAYAVPPPVAPSPYHHYPAFTPPPPPPPAKSASPPAQAEQPKDNSELEEIKQILKQEREEREAREKAAKEAEEAKIAAAEAAQAKAAEIAAAAAAAAEAATTEAEKKAAEAAAEEAAKRQVEAEEAANKAKEEKEAAIAEAKAAAAPSEPAEKFKPIKFKDAVGRKFNFPYHLCATWSGMEDLIRQAFMHVDVIGPHVAEGHYDLIGPGNEIILPGVWDSVIEPDTTITMHMWPMPEPKEEEEPPPIEVPEAPQPEPEEPKKATKKPPKKPPSFWFGGPRKPKNKQIVKKKPPEE